ncbi:hypothetical protein BCR33DRAFT_714346 [Rhizoclosmatium globosum]|uniref:Uncharacterized protein n=1 Tax=Rhizoclosmatium globosum TaxID=329046 RepID=A0A1Y2CNJ7_9FUNG|nr:hypothetical protein BCR33DRAFT_714346 [Rhizoclosmatium globosum]|eukprot:ORY48598.1 hypothetical protein BCR33DRAFT_714346 [Rhizoclosmatium globosum]
MAQRLMILGSSRNRNNRKRRKYDEFGVDWKKTSNGIYNFVNVKARDEYSQLWRSSPVLIET